MNLIIIILLNVLVIINCKEAFAKQNEILKSHNLATKLFEYFHNSNVSEKCKTTAQFYSQHFNESWAIQCKSKLIVLIIWKLRVFHEIKSSMQVAM